ncbi:MAG: hypothetical protein KatS3mg101_0651 [Patescibacteria group bacterium]|nr:MAG: hypothetical protein KatS3mg101_0651 [Patescibacteria group bacterium]
MTKHYKQNKKRANLIITKLARHFAALYNVKINRISIRNQKTRWGSCSKSGNLNFNYKLIFLPQELRNYVIIHEICHLLEFNHSKKFWAQVEILVPNYKEVRKVLRFTHTPHL